LEVWSVKTAGNQILISRLDGSDGGTIRLTAGQPLKSTGEQTFSSFADVKQYIDTITTQQSQPGQASQATQEIEVKAGDTLQKLSQLYKAPPEKIMELNPSITRWTSLQVGQKILVPASASSSSAIAPQKD
jgi:LysM repeat protein